MNRIDALIPGDRVTTYKGLVFVHPVVYVGNGIFVEKSKTGLVRLRHHSTFAAGENFVVAYRPPPHQAQAVVRRAMASLGQQPYDLFRANCQHFVNAIYTGLPRSEQVEGFTALAVFALAMGLIGAAFGG